ncbi:MAG: UvrB/UvrC motif-containing protein [Candidatus Krumholzibacteria bacterium]|nr:UvrB/UvrC motif-containing protein [Candidatus Krumholzibacteria bacterium]
MAVRCKICGNRPATIHYTEIVNDKMVTLDLCVECAQEKGIDVQTSGAYGLGDLVAELIDGTVKDETAKIGRVRCPECGYDYSDFRNMGRFGCPECYRSFEAQLNPLLRHIHGSTQHVGKTPVRLGGKSAARQRALQLKEELARAIDSEAYERAAELRDEIRRVEAETAKEKTANPDVGRAATGTAEAADGNNDGRGPRDHESKG